MSVGSSTGYIKIGFRTFDVADKVQVRYNGSIIFDSGNVQTATKFKLFVVPIVYVSGVNTADIIITNSNPSVNTIWDIRLACCNPKTPCPVNLPLVTISASQINCGCQFTIGGAYDTWEEVWAAFCLQVDEYFYMPSPNVGGCAQKTISSNTTCVDCAGITVTKVSGQAGFVLTLPSACASRYTELKNTLNSAGTNQWVSIVFKKVSCASDGVTYGLTFFPHQGSMTFDDANRKITYTMPASNPYADDCSNCNKIRRTAYQNSYNQLNNAGYLIFTNSPYACVHSYVVYDAQQQNANTILFEDRLNTECGNVVRKYRITYREASCPCESWELYEDTNNDGTYETLRLQAAGWTGSCMS